MAAGGSRVEMTLDKVKVQTKMTMNSDFGIWLGRKGLQRGMVGQQRHNQPEKQRNKGTNVQFFLPQVLVLIFEFMFNCEDANSRIKILGDPLELENGWQAWLVA
uniref:DUF4704 domain-containing protein n=1 Tax=Lactuca sativa TaxID=4236 RepID=A0A9R1VV70_LACSA|nr:hypothetical protein LSAT_V11C400203850 [Lactuca sativa]